MEKIDKLDNTQKDWAYKALKWITCAVRPLKSKELLQATAIEPWSSTFEPSRMSNIAYLIETCCHLVTLDEHQGVVRFVHYSVQEFLQSRSEFSGTQELVASICITSLGLWQEFMTWKEEYSIYVAGRIDIYAAENWQLHVKQLSTVSIRQLLPLIQKIFSDFRNFRQWHSMYRPLVLDKRPRVPFSKAPAYLAVCSFFEITTAVALFLQDETTEPVVKQYALRAAAAAGSQESVQLLLENQVNINARKGEDGNAL